jgi:cellulose synthase/poly-beta-1,6-N-acetylglucosamine synthase-like glycosyltransferase
MLFDEIVLIVYILTMIVVLAFSSHGIIMLFYHRKYIENIPSSLSVSELNKKVTIQLPLYNEQYVTERLINAVCKIEYPKDLLEIQVLDDSTDNTVDIVKKLVDEKVKENFDIKHIRRVNRKGYKAGALKEGLQIAKGELIAIFDADFVPRPDFLKNTLKYFINPKNWDGTD